ncbi:response regulator transcription factor [Levilactobacillus tangyuanensis]|uniref:Response regulator transcription factor n=1 Tax=Levilactobacillus tangyuanensis TaxID=2486021 RepID=A0ABW1TQM1_9LACO|nr:response regulator transcription factor [Levilactobacillus tangyuanensis]
MLVLAVYLCEDNVEQLTHYRDVVERYIMINDYDMQVRLATPSPRELLNDLEKASPEYALFFLDIEFPGEQTTGLETAIKIRQHLGFAEIVFVTTHSEMALLTFERKVEPMDFVVKDLGRAQIDQKLRENVDYGYQRYTNYLGNTENLFSYTIGGRKFSLPMGDVYFVATAESPHKVTVHAANQLVEFPGFLKDIADQYPELYRTDKSFLVNLDNVSGIDSVNRRLVFPNGDETDVATRRFHEVKTLVQKHLKG